MNDRLLFETIDTGCFPAFWHVAQTLNFTEAARKAHMTQSGVSQHIAKLEQQLGTQLFQRTNRRVQLTEAGKKLRRYLQKYFDELATLRADITSANSALAGLVRYAMPTSCLMSPHFDMLLAARTKDFPAIELQVHIHDNAAIERMLINEQVDFGFVTEKLQSPQLQLRPFCLENYVLVGQKSALPKSAQTDALAAAAFVGYPNAPAIYDMWRHAQGLRSQHSDWSQLNVRGEMSDLYGILKMLLGGVGCTVIAEHCVANELKSKQLHKLTTPHNKPVTNQIYIAQLRGVTQSARVERVINEFFAMLD